MVAASVHNRKGKIIIIFSLVNWHARFSSSLDLFLCKDGNEDVHGLKPVPRLLRTLAITLFNLLGRGRIKT